LCYITEYPVADYSPLVAFAPKTEQVHCETSGKTVLIKTSSLSLSHFVSGRFCGFKFRKAFSSRNPEENWM